MSVEAGVTACLAWTDSGHGWLWTSLRLDEAGPFPVLVVSTDGGSGSTLQTTTWR
jgi:hypothetical protein